MPEFSGWNVLGEVLLLVGSAVAMGVVLGAAHEACDTICT